MPYVEIDSPLTGSTVPLEFRVDGTFEGVDDAGNVIAPYCTIEDSNANNIDSQTATVNGSNWYVDFTLTTPYENVTIIAELPGLNQDDSHTDITISDTEQPTLKIDAINAPPSPAPVSTGGGVAGGAVVAAAPVDLPVSGTYTLGSHIICAAMSYKQSDRLDQIHSSTPATLNPAAKTWSATVKVPANPNGRTVIRSIMFDRKGRIMSTTARKRKKK